MKTRDNLFYDNDRLCIRLAEGGRALKGYEAPQNKVPAMLYRNGELIDVNWQSVSVINGDSSLSFWPTDLFHEIPYTVNELATVLKPRALEFIVKLSYAIEMAEKRLDWGFGAIPTSSFYFFENGDVLLMSAQIADIIDRFEFDAQRFDDKEKWYAHNCVNDFGKAHFLFQLVHFALTGVAPFESDAIRLTGFQALPMELYFAPENTKILPLCQEVNKAFSNNKKFMYQTRKPYDYFREAIERSTADLSLEDMQGGENPRIGTYIEARDKKAQRRTFWRKRGVLVSVITLAVAAVIYIAAYYIHLAVKAPETKDLNEVQMIEYYYDAYTRLDVSGLGEPLKYGYDGPDLNEIAAKYVTSTMQQAYEGGSQSVDARKWIADGMPAIKQNYSVFGVTDIKVRQISEDVFEATIELYAPDDYFDRALDDEDMRFLETDHVLIYKYREVVQFTFRTRKTWREITDIKLLDIQLTDVIDVPYVANDNTDAKLSTSVLTMFQTF